MRWSPVVAWPRRSRVPTARISSTVPAGVPLQLRVHLAGFRRTGDRPSPARRSPITRNVTLPVGGVSDTLIVTAARTAASRASVTESVSALPVEDIEALGSASLADVVRFVPAVNVESTGREGAVTSMFSRGGESDYNLVLIDGVRVNQSGGMFDFSRINAAEIDRVEVVRGAQSALWGSDAMGSVVQVFTRRAGAGDAPQRHRRRRRRIVRHVARRRAGHGGAQRACGLPRRRVASPAPTARSHDMLPEDDEFEQDAVDGGVGVMLGRRASAASQPALQRRPTGRTVGQITYGVARHRHAPTRRSDLSWHVELHARDRLAAAPASATLQRLPLREPVGGHRSAIRRLAPTRCSTGTPNALFPNGTRLVRLIDVTEFNSLVARRCHARRPASSWPRARSSDFPFDQRHASSTGRRSATRAITAWPTGSG